MFRRVWKAVETDIGKVGIGKTAGGGSKGGSRKEMGGKK